MEQFWTEGATGQTKGAKRRKSVQSAQNVQNAALVKVLVGQCAFLCDIGRMYKKSDDMVFRCLNWSKAL